MLEIQGHRGCRGHLPENTLAGFFKAIEWGVEWLEMDLLMTQDNHMVLHHDFFLNPLLCSYEDGRPVPTDKLIRDLSLEELKVIDFGRFCHPEFPNQTPIHGSKILTLEEFFEHMKGQEVNFNIEIKRSSGNPDYTFSPETLAKQTVSAVKKAGMDARVTYASFDLEVLSAIRRLDAEAKIRLNLETLQNAREMARSINTSFLCPEHSLLVSKSDAKELHEAGLFLTPWTVNDPKRWKELIDMEVYGIITDFPLELKSFLKENL